MKTIKRLAAVLLAGIMALALLTACSGSDAGNPEFDAKVESAYLAALNKKFGKEFENDADIKALAVKQITENSSAESLTNEKIWKTDGNKTDGNEKTVVRQVMLCWELKKGTGKSYVPFFYEAATAQNIKVSSSNILALFRTVNKGLGNAEENGRTLELTALGVGAKTIGGKTYVAIGYELTRSAAQ